ncbi:MAG: type II toxin-antitoxin system VapC family toxin [Proteobacteria bacterium]|nr:type II toxin-antitoxin system VapC family toxin [Pseudomonadota bacterium]MDA1022189.1 type II toxin-antitoxin system VapC family toxin [Pseudomonadota bacterium]
MDNIVLDASAALAVFKREPGDDVVKGYIPGALMSAVNVAEIVGKLAGSGLTEVEVHAAISTLGVEIVNFDEEHAFATGMLGLLTRKHGLSLADRACLSLARIRQVGALTADRVWAELDIGVDVVLIR